MNILERKVRAYFEFIPKLYLETKSQLYPKYYKDNKSNNNKKNETGIIFDNSIEIFKEIIDFLDNLPISNLENENETENIHISKLYSIVFVKMYLSKLVYFIKEKHDELGSIKEIINIIQNIKNKPFGNVIKIYVFKLFYYYMNNNFEIFKNYNYKTNGIEFYNDFPTLYREKDEIMLTYFFLPLDDLEKYMEIYNSFEEIRSIKFNKDTKEMSDLIIKNGLNNFVAVSLNKIISNLALKNYVADKDDYQNFSSFIKSLFSFNSEHKLSPELSKILFLFYDEKNYTEKLRVKLAKEDEVLNQ